MPEFELISIGDSFDFGAHRFTAEEIKRFARAYDPQGFHTDETAAAESHFGALCASGWHTASVMMGLLVRHFARQSEEAAERGEAATGLGPSPGFDNLQWLRPVYAGDEIAFFGRIVAKRETRSRPGWGIVSMEVTGTNQKGQPVFAYTGHIFAPIIETT